MRTWLALLAAPVFMLTDQSIAYALTGWACASQRIAPMHGVHLGFAALSLAATILAAKLWRETTDEAKSPEIARRHFLAGVAVAIGAFSTLVILAMWIPNWMLSPCST
jgi:hypothetical protein